MASHTDTLVSVAEYLATNYEPDAEYVGGRIIERNVRQWGSFKFAGRVGGVLLQSSRRMEILVATEQRMALSSDRFRIPGCVCSPLV